MPSPMQPLTSEALQSVRLIASDMDGTLTQRGKFTPLLLQTLTDLANAGIPVVIVTGRSAGWVSGLVHYLPVAGAIAENGGCFFSATGAREQLVSLADVPQHRQQLAQMFAELQAEFPQIQVSDDNAFRLSDWTFDVQGLTTAELQHMSKRCYEQGWGFTYSTVQCHIKLLRQEKSIGLQTVLERYFPQYSSAEIVTVGDSPNDESLFNPEWFPCSVGVANVQHYAEHMTHRPTYITTAPEVQGFCELAALLLSLSGDFRR
ncbi:MAG: HAD family phosphatase [Synechococcales cyanobacterium M58_A2018_015]|nr:HAD family phosphatase [Synechococcales cyanobacterium M58_A2018_015]